MPKSKTTHSWHVGQVIGAAVGALYTFFGLVALGWAFRLTTPPLDGECFWLGLFMFITGAVIRRMTK